ncbi:MAG: AAA family ATPase, partial [Fibrobacteria bacterium]
MGEDPLALPPSRQARALLACLAVAEKPLQRARLCELLWENSADPRGALRWCLSRLKAVVDTGGTARLAAEGDTLWIDPESWEVDARQLRSLARSIGAAETPALESGAARFAGPFLADLELGDAIRFESWRTGEEKSLARDRAAVFAEILRRHADSPEAKVRLGHIWVQQDPLDERPHAAILEALTALGRKREALSHYERCVKMLRRHGNAPGAALEKARRDIGPLGQSGPVSPDALSSAPAPPTDAPGNGAAHRNTQGTSGAALAGREREMDRFRAFAADPDSRLRILAGEPGIGKTRLLEEMGERLEAEGWLVLRGRAFEAERDRALGPWIDAGRAVAARSGAGDCPLLKPASLPERGLAEQGSLFEAMRSWLAALAARCPLALILDDVHWLDAASVALLQYLLRGSDSPFRLALAGMRSVAAPADPPITPLLRLAQRESWSETWDIGPLDAAGTASLLRAAGSDRDPGEVFARSAGHPLASLALAMEADSAGPRATLDAMLDERIRVAGEDGRQVLQWSALLGRGLPPALLEALLDMPVQALLSALERLEAQGLMRVVEGEGGMEYLFGHDLIRQRSQDSLSAPRRARMHAHVASILRAQPALRRGWEEVAFHAEAGAQWVPAAEACLEAGGHCFRLRAFPAMVGFLEKGMDHLDRTGGHWALQREFCLLANRAV